MAGGRLPADNFVPVAPAPACRLGPPGGAGQVPGEAGRIVRGPAKKGGAAGAAVFPEPARDARRGNRSCGAAGAGGVVVVVVIFFFK